MPHPIRQPGDDPVGGRRIAVLAVLAITLAFSARLTAAIAWQARLPAGTQFGFGDSEGYWQLGRAIARGEPYAYPDDEYRVFRMPGYPLALAPLFVAGDEPPVMLARAWHALVSSLAAGGVLWLGLRLFNLKVGALAALVAAVYPGLVFLGAVLLSEGLFCAILPFQFVFWHNGWTARTRRPFAGWHMAAGALAGAATLVRPSWLLFTPLAVLAGIALGSDRRRHALAGCCLLAGLCLAMAPWWVRNYIVTGSFVPTTLQVGASLYDGLNPTADGSSDMQFVEPMTERLRALSNDRSTRETFEYRADQAFRRAATNWAREHPAEAVRLAGIKFARLWNPWPNDPQFRQPLIGLVVAGTYLPVLILGFIGLWRYRRRGWMITLLALPAIYFTLLHVVFVSSIRYRQPAMVLLTIPAAAAVVRCRSAAAFNRDPEATARNRPPV